MEGRTRLPDAVDFGADNNGDARWAWEEFGGLSINQACEKLASNPLCYSEAFMWMEQPAFAYYFPAIERYLRRYADGAGMNDLDDSSASALAYALSTHFVASDVRLLVPISGPAQELVSFVRNHLSQLATCPIDQTDIDSAWQILEAQLTQLQSRR